MGQSLLFLNNPVAVGESEIFYRAGVARTVQFMSGQRDRLTVMLDKLQKKNI